MSIAAWRMASARHGVSKVWAKPDVACRYRYGGGRLGGSRTARSRHVVGEGASGVVSISNSVKTDGGHRRHKNKFDNTELCNFSLMPASAWFE
jgi:hypothetical protein